MGTFPDNYDQQFVYDSPILSYFYLITRMLLRNNFGYYRGRHRFVLVRTDGRTAHLKLLESRSSRCVIDRSGDRGPFAARIRAESREQSDE